MFQFGCHLISILCPSVRTFFVLLAACIMHVLWSSAIVYFLTDYQQEDGSMYT